MKRVILIAVAMFTLATSASAQFDLSRLFGGSKSTSTSTQTEAANDPYKRLAQAAPAATQLEGRWSYESASFSYVGNNYLASMAVAQLDTVIRDVLKQMGVTTGSAQLQLKGGKGVISQGDQSLHGTYTYNRSTAGVVASTTVDGKEVSVSGYVKYSSGRLSVMLDVKQMIAAIKSVFPEYKDDPNILLVESLIKDLGDVYVVGRFVTKK